MISAPWPHKTTHLNLKDAPHPTSRANLASSFANTNSSSTRAILRSHSLPTPALSPAPSLSASQSSSASASASASASDSAFSSPLVNMLTLASPPAAVASFAHLATAPGRSFSPFASAVNSSRCVAMRQSMSGHGPMTPDASCLALPMSMSMLEPELESKHLDLDLLESFRATKSRVLRLSGVPSPSSSSSSDSSVRAARALASLFPADDGSKRPSAIPVPTPVRMWTLRANANANAMAMELGRDGDERPVWAVFTSHEEACTLLTVAAGFGVYGHGYDSGLGCLRSLSPSVDVMPALESELEPFSKLQPFDLSPMLTPLESTTATTDQLRHLNHLTQSAIPMTGGGVQQSLMRYPPSPTSSTATDPETEAELYFPDAQDDLRFSRGLSLSSSNYPSRSFGIGHGHSYGSANAYTARSMTPATNTIDALQSMHACGFTLSSNPPKPRTGFRHGDWICADPVCAAHNFGRNVTCIQCAAPRPPNLDIGVGNGGGGGGYAPFNCSNGSMNGQNGSFSPLTARNLSPRFVANTANMTAQAQTHQQRQYQQQHELLLKAQMQTHAQAQTHPLLTPSGRAFAVGGKVQNISPDPLAPCIMFWPDNEPFPEPGQIRPASLSSIAHPPIMNTGNKGPIERQPGDWVCQKCNYLNWRRRKVCQTCFPYAEGNGDSVSVTMHAERLALLAAVYGQVHPQLANHAQASQHFPGRAQNLNGAHQAPVPTASTQLFAAPSSVISPSARLLTTTPSALHRSQSPSARAATLRTQIPPPLSVATSVNNSRGLAGKSHPGHHSQSTAESSSLGAGSIVYETPPSPAVARPPPSISSALAHGPRTSSAQTFSTTRAGPLLPPFLKHETQALHPGPRYVPSAISTAPAPIGTGTRSPASLSPVSSSTSADLPLEEHAGPAKSVGVIGSGRNASFYAHPRGAGSGSSMGSSSSLTLAAGSSIWSLERDEDKAWKSDASSALDALKGLAL